MVKVFNAVERIRPFYDMVYKAVLLLCKILLITDILITTMAVAGRFISFIPDPSWSEEVVLTLMAYMAVLSAALAIRKRAHIRMTAFDDYLPKRLVIYLDIISDIFVLILALVMVFVGWKYAVTIGSKGTYVSMPNLSRFWMYFPIPLAGFGMIVFQLEILFSHFKKVLVGESEN
ncbi:MAG: TRAP transporter small permease [Tissierellaceae bacterium]